MTLFHTAQAADKESVEKARVRLLGHLPERASVSDATMAYILSTFDSTPQRQAAAKYVVIASKAMSQVSSTGNLDFSLGKQLFAASDCITWHFPADRSDFMNRTAVSGLYKSILDTEERKAVMAKTMKLATAQGHKLGMFPEPGNCEAIGVVTPKR